MGNRDESARRPEPQAAHPACVVLANGPRYWQSIRDRLRELYPEYSTVSEVAKAFRLTIPAIKNTHHARLAPIRITELDGSPLATPVWLYSNTTVKNYLAKRRRTGKTTQIAFRGIEVERIQQICERYYRQNLDIGAPELLVLAKKVAKL